ncbi:hypothetical protein HF568_12815, partial [Acidithiobacillus ferridurans]|nr:hypothetical protein [Acidithiobacillus ferridurans]
LHYTNGGGGVSATPTNTASAGSPGSSPVVITNVGNGAVVANGTDAVNGGQLYGAEQTAQAQANQAQTNAEGYAGQVAHQAQTTAEGYAGQVAASDSNQALQAANQHSNGLFTMTCHQAGNGSGDIVCGRNAQVSGQNSSAQGTDAQASGAGANAYGANTKAVGEGATAIGNSAVAAGISTTALGDHAEAVAPNSTALGENSVALGAGSAALGYGSMARRANSVSVGNAAAGLHRQVTNVAAGTQPHDAVNLQQFQDGLQGLQAASNAEADKVGSVDASLGEAAAQAAAGVGNNTISGATADYNGQASFAFSYQHRFSYHWTGDVTVASNGGAANTVAAAGAGYSW